jgi:hypothetical protein
MIVFKEILSRLKQKLILPLFYLISGLGLGFFIMYVIVFQSVVDFGNTENDTIQYTNYGIAFFLGLASVAFSWARNITGNENLSRDINRNGVRSIALALFFIITSLFKYSLMHGSIEDEYGRTFFLACKGIYMIFLIINLMGSIFIFVSVFRCIKKYLDQNHEL